MKKELNIGDKIIKYNYGKPVAKLTINRVTKTQAMAGNLKFKRQYSTIIHKIGAGRWYQGIYYPATDERIKEYEDMKRRRQLLESFKSINRETLTNEQIEYILKYLGIEQ